MTQKKPKTKQRVEGPGLIGRTVRGVFRIVFGFAWRLAAVVALVVFGAAGFFYAQLPAYDQLFDGRGVGSRVSTQNN